MARRGPQRRPACTPGAAAGLLVAALALSVAPPAGADWLLTRDGARLETAGPWRVDGKLVVFTKPGGTLASLRLAEVDLEASAAATAAGEESRRQVAAAAAAPAERRRAVLVITDADVAPAADGGATATADAAAGEGPTTTFQVTTWKRTVDEAGGEATIDGELRNGGADAVSAPPLRVSIFDEEGGALAVAAAVFDSPSIPPGDRVRFRATFPGVGTFAAATFRIGEAASPGTPEPPPSPAP